MRRRGVVVTLVVLGVALLVVTAMNNLWRVQPLSLIHISEPTRLSLVSRMPSSA